MEQIDEAIKQAQRLYSQFTQAERDKTIKLGEKFVYLALNEGYNEMQLFGAVVGLMLAQIKLLQVEGKL